MSDPPTTQEVCGRWYRSRGQSIVIAVLIGVMGSFSLLLALAIVLPPGDIAPRVTAAMLGVCCALLLVGGFRSALCGVRRCGSVVEIRNPLSNVRVEIADIEAVGRGRWSLFPKVGLLFLSDGSMQHIWGIQAPNLFGTSYTDRLLGRLAADIGVANRLASSFDIQRSAEG